MQTVFALCNKKKNQTRRKFFEFQISRNEMQNREI